MDIHSEIMFYGSPYGSTKNYISGRISDDIPPQMKIFNSYPLIMQHIILALTVLPRTHLGVTSSIEKVKGAEDKVDKNYF